MNSVAYTSNILSSFYSSAVVSAYSFISYYASYFRVFH